MCSKNVYNTFHVINFAISVRVAPAHPSTTKQLGSPANLPRRMPARTRKKAKHGTKQLVIAIELSED
jgi:hypothetical protein